MFALPSYAKQSKSVTRDSRDGRHLFLSADAAQRDYELQLYEYLAAFYAPKYQCGLVQCVLLSNRVHLSVRDHTGKRSSFQTTLHSVWVRTLHRVTGGRGAKFEPGPTSCPMSLDAKAEKEALLEAALAPVANGLVPNSRLWAGTIFTPEDAGKKRVVRRPAGLNPRIYPPEIEYVVALPLHQEGDSPALVRRRFRDARLRAEARLVAEFEDAGMEFAGVEELSTLDPKVVPAVPLPPAPRELFRSTKPHLLEAALEELRKFRTRYPECLKALRDGIVDILWPAGTNYHHFINGFPRESGLLRLACGGPQRAPS